MEKILPLIPIVLFRVSYEFNSLLVAVLLGVLAALGVFFYELIFSKKASYLSLVTISIMAVFCLIDAASSQDDWVMLGTSIVGLVYSGVFFLAFMDYSQELSALMRIPVKGFPEKIQKKIFRNSAVFFLLLAIINELVWRTQAEAVWVEFRAFVVFPSLMLYAGVQITYFSVQLSRKAETRRKGDLSKLIKATSVDEKDVHV